MHNAITLERLADIKVALQAGWRLLAAPVPIQLSAWAAEYFYLSPESSYAEQHFEAYPYQRAILDCMGNDAIEEIVFCKSTRLGFTKLALCGVFYFAAHKRRNQVLYQPTDDDRDHFVKTELEPALRDVPIMAATFPAFMRRHKDNTLKLKRGIGCSLHLRGGASATNYRRLTVDVAILDEVDAFATDVEGEGNPIVLAANRTEGATFPKLICGSTPKTKGLSLIDAREQQADLRLEFRIPCPHCDEEVPLVWGGPNAKRGLRWDEGRPDRAVHICVACGEPFSQQDYFAVWQAGGWFAQGGTSIDSDGAFRDANGEPVPAPRSVAFRLWTAYSPATTWAAIARKFVSAKAKADEGDSSELKTFFNQTLGESWEEQSEKVEGGELRSRAEAYPVDIVPAAAAILTAGVDVQEDRFEIVVYGWGPGSESWAMAQEIIYGDTALPEPWTQLGAYLAREFECADGGRARIHRAAIDCGFRTFAAYAFVRARRGRMMAVKGHQVPGKDILRENAKVDVNHRGQVIPHGLVLWLIGTDRAKDLLHDRLKLARPGPGYIHLSEELPGQFFAGMASEQRSRVKSSRGVVSRWTKRHSAIRNEALDCSVYALAAALHLRVPNLTPAQWEAVRETQHRGTAAGEKPNTPKPAPQEQQRSIEWRNPRRGSWITGWR